jgi:hypothetical protein
MQEAPMTTICIGRTAVHPRRAYGTHAGSAPSTVYVAIFKTGDSYTVHGPKLGHGFTTLSYSAARAVYRREVDRT